jgi:threonine aldolase
VNAKALASGLAGVEGLETHPDEVENNMVLVRVRSMPPQQLVQHLQAQGVLVLAVGPETIRAVTNLMVSAEDIQRAVAAFTAGLRQRLRP